MNDLSRLASAVGVDFEFNEDSFQVLCRYHEIVAMF